jgi:hypothetical protein
MLRMIVGGRSLVVLSVESSCRLSLRIDFLLDERAVGCLLSARCVCQKRFPTTFVLRGAMDGVAPDLVVLCTTKERVIHHHHGRTEVVQLLSPYQLPVTVIVK